MIKEYKVSKHNSTVLGYPGRNFDWSKFDWKQESSYDFGEGIAKAPKVFVDNCAFFIDNDCEYLHVPYNYSIDGTVYRVRPNESMRPHKIYRGYMIQSVKAIQHYNGDWYWQLNLTEIHNKKQKPSHI